MMFLALPDLFEKSMMNDLFTRQHDKNFKAGAVKIIQERPKAKIKIIKMKIITTKNIRNPV